MKSATNNWYYILHNIDHFIFQLLNALILLYGNAAELLGKVAKLNENYLLLYFRYIIVVYLIVTYMVC